jgi:hypothetical protein
VAAAPLAPSEPSLHLDENDPDLAEVIKARQLLNEVRRQPSQPSNATPQVGAV